MLELKKSKMIKVTVKNGSLESRLEIFFLLMATAKKKKTAVLVQLILAVKVLRFFSVLMAWLDNNA
jgi:hypothetical protein